MGGLGLWQTLLTLLVFGLTFALGNSLLPQARRDMYLAVRAENFLLSDYELKRRKEGWLANQLAVLLPRLERIMDLSGYGVNLKRMLAMMGNTKGLELVLAEQITKAGLFAGCMLVVPFLTGSKVYFLLVPVAFIVLMLIQNREIYRKYKKWQNEIIKDIPLLIDKIQISMEAGKPLLHALQQVYKSASPRLRIMLERLLLDMQIMKQTEAIDKFARATESGNDHLCGSRKDCHREWL